MLIVEQSSMKTERTGLGVITQGGGIMGAHLEENAHFEFAQALAA